jgi:hypothetical protein
VVLARRPGRPVPCLYIFAVPLVMCTKHSCFVLYECAHKQERYGSNHFESVGLEIVKKESRVLDESQNGKRITRYFVILLQHTQGLEVGFLFSSSGLRNCIVFDCINAIVCWRAIASSVMHVHTRRHGCFLLMEAVRLCILYQLNITLEGMN